MKLRWRKVCQFEGYVNCVHPWDVLRGASKSSVLYAAKKGARRKQQFVDAFAKSRNAPIIFIMSVRPSYLPFAYVTLDPP